MEFLGYHLSILFKHWGHFWNNILSDHFRLNSFSNAIYLVIFQTMYFSTDMSLNAVGAPPSRHIDFNGVPSLSHTQTHWQGWWYRFTNFTQMELFPLPSFTFQLTVFQIPCCDSQSPGTIIYCCSLLSFLGRIGHHTVHLPWKWPCTYPPGQL